MRHSKLFILAIMLSAAGSASALCSKAYSDLSGIDSDVVNSEDITLELTDTLTSSPAVQLEEFIKKEEPSVFVPKGQWVTGLSVSYSQSNQNKYQFLVIENLSGDTYSFKISPMVLYVFKDDMGAGARFAYSRSLTKLENADIVLDSETDYSVDHLYRLAHNYYGTLILRNYFALGSSKRFGIFNETQLQLGGGQSKIMNGLGSTLSGSYETNFSLNVGFAPGLAFFLSDYAAVEVNVGVLGYSYTHTKTLTDRIYEANRKSQSANFRINLFSISFGVAWYL